ESPASGYVSGAALGESALHPMAHRSPAYEERSLSGPRRAINQSWGRLGSRVETIVNRVIDELTDAIEATLVPALSGWVRQRPDFGDTGHGRAPRAIGGERGMTGGVHAGGPAGSQHYPSQGPRTADQG